MIDPPSFISTLALPATVISCSVAYANARLFVLAERGLSDSRRGHSIPRAVRFGRNFVENIRCTLAELSPSFSRDPASSD